MSVIVVLDDPAAESTVRALLVAGEQLIVTGGRVGGAAARNLGLRSSISDFVAFLDDDDYWEPTKLDEQVALLSQESGDLGFTYTWFHETSGDVRLIPRWPFRQGNRIADYLVARRRLTHGDGYLQTSSLLLRRSVLGKIEWDETLPKHQDWDYIVRLSHATSKPLCVVPRPLVHVAQGSPSSVSQRRNWRDSQTWLDKHGASIGPRARADFILTQIMRSSLASRQWGGVVRSFRELFRSGLPHPAAVIVGVSGILERTQPRGEL